MSWEVSRMPTVSQGKSRAARVARDGVLAALALLFSYVESLLPLGHVLPLPGFRVGLANVVVTLVLFEIGMGDAAVVALIKTVVSALLFGSPVSFAFSAAGTALSFGGLALIRRMFPDRLSYVGICIAGAALHNSGQICAAMVIFGVGVATYLPVLLAASVVLGGVCGGVVCLIAPAFRKILGGRAA